MPDTSPQPPEPNPLFEPLRAMLGLLPPAALSEITLALHASLNSPPSAAERRVRDLLLLARVLEEQPQPPDRLPYTPRRTYDERRAADPSAGPQSARLVERFGSWRRACNAAWGLLDDGRSWGAGMPWAQHPPRPKNHPLHPKNYAVSEAVTSIKTSIEALGHVPSSAEYHEWVLARRRRARDRGEDTRPYVHYASVMRLLAPDRVSGNGWLLALTRTLRDD